MQKIISKCKLRLELTHNEKQKLNNTIAKTILFNRLNTQNLNKLLNAYKEIKKWN